MIQILTRNLLLLVALCCLSLVVVRPIFSGRVYAQYDLREQFLPFRAFYSLCLEQHELGLWNPFLCRGHNHLGEGQAGLLHPVHILVYRFLPLDVAILLEMFLYIPVALLGMALFLGAGLRLTPRAALTGAGLFAFSVFMIGHQSHLNMVWVHAHLPFVLFCLDRCFRGRRPWRFAAGLALLVASMLLLGHPQMVWINALAVAAYLVYLVVARPIDRNANGRMIADEHRNARKRSLIVHLIDKKVLKRLALLLLATIAGLLLGLPQLLPTAAYVRESPRGSLSAAERNNFSLPPAAILSNLSPFVYKDRIAGDRITTPETGQVYFTSDEEFPAYLGLASLSVIYFGLILFRGRIFHRRHRSTLIIAGVTILLFVLLALGRCGGVNELIRYLPLVSQFRAPVRYLAGVIAVLSIIVAVMFHLFDTDAESATARPVPWLRLCLPIPAAIAVLCVAATRDALTVSGIHYPFSALACLIVGPLLAVAVFLSILLYVRQRPWRNLALALLTVCCVIDVGVWSLPTLLQRRQMPVAEVSAAQKKMKSRDHNFRRVSKLNEPWLDGWYMANGYLGIAVPEPLDLFGEKKSNQTVHHLRLTSVAKAYGIEQLHSVPEPLPRLRLARRLQHADAPLDGLGDIDLHQTALCRPSLAPELDGPAISAGETVTFEYDGYERIGIGVTVQHPRLLVLADRWSPDWQVKVDGVERELLPLFDGIGRGVIVNPSDRRVTMRFRPALLYTGLRAAGVGLVLLVLMVIMDLRPAKQRSNG